MKKLQLQEDVHNENVKKRRWRTAAIACTTILSAFCGMLLWERMKYKGRWELMVDVATRRDLYTEALEATVKEAYEAGYID